MAEFTEDFELDSESWVGIQVTVTSTLISTAAFCVVFEFARRLSVTAFVFDQRRQVRPNHTPPPLIKQRYLQWLFLSTEPAYSEYASQKEEEYLNSIKKSEKKNDDDHKTEVNFPVLLSPSDALSPIGNKEFTFDENTSAKTHTPKSSPKAVKFGSPKKRIPPVENIPGVVRLNDRMIPAAIAEYAISHDLNDDQLDALEQQLDNNEKRNVKLNDNMTNSTCSVSTENRLLKKADVSMRNVMEQIEKESSKEKHLKSTSTLNRRPLNMADAELFRCVGLDVFLMLKFLDLGFNVTFHPFLFACITLIPTYYTNMPVDDSYTEEFRTGGYFRFTINRLEPGSAKLWIPWVYLAVVICYILRQLWNTWETFMELRFDFLANGTSILVERSAKKMEKSFQNNNSFGVEMTSDVDLHKQQFRNSCIVEYIPKSHRSDKDLYDFFDAIFPGQVKRAEILINAAELTELIRKRQKCIEAYEDIYAKYFHAKSVYQKKITQYNNQDTAVSTLRYFCCFSCGKPPNKPTHPMKIVKKHKFLCLKCCKEEEHKALPYYLSEITRLNGEIEKGHRRIVEERRKAQMMEKDNTSKDKGLFDVKNHVAQGLQQGLSFISGGGWELNSSTGFVEFQNLTAKQSAIQCNITGTAEYMVAETAPDPRDILWENASTESSTIKWKSLQCNVMLFAGTLVWSAVVSFIQGMTNALIDLDPEKQAVFYGLVQGYFPILMLEGLMTVLTTGLLMLATKYIRFKTSSETDKFVFIWHFNYRLANLLIILVAGSLMTAVTEISDNPKVFVQKLANGIGSSSQFFLNNIIVQAGSEHLFELAQVSRMAVHFIMHKIVKVQAKSQRYLEKLHEPQSFEWGQVIPPFIFTMSVGLIYSATVPIVTGAAALSFFIAKKVYTHQALFVYAQTYEGGGKLMYTLNRMIFIQLYVSILIFSVVLGLKNGGYQAPSFFFLLTGVTIILDQRIQSIFVKPSLTLALTNARTLDDEIKAKEEKIMKHFSSVTLRAKAAKVANKARKIVRMKRVAIEQEKQKLIENEIKVINAQNEGGEDVEAQEEEADLECGVKTKKIEPQAVEMKSDEVEDVQAANEIDEDIEDMDNTFNDFFLFRQPQLNKHTWETKPRPYR